MQKILVVGAGLAGLTASKLLAERGFEVKVLDASSRAGGKAGADLEAGIWREHGYHIFPPWYVNTRPIVEGLGTKFIDFDRWNYILPGKLHAPIAVEAPNSPGALIRAVTSGLMPWPDTLLHYYFMLDMMSKPLKHKAVLDQVSRVGMMRDRWYMTEGVSELEAENVLKASAIPAYDMSAMTTKIISSLWMRTLSPFLSILPGDLQATFIEPYLAQVRAAGATVELGTEVTRIETVGGRISAVYSRRVGGGPETKHVADAFILTTPLEITRKLIGGQVQKLDPDLGNFEHLQAAPMAALHLDLNRKLPSVPAEHCFLHKGRYGLSFIDNSQHWPGETNTQLSFIASNFIPLRDLTPEEQYEALFGEISEYLGITEADVAAYSLKPNTDTPLFINTIGAWTNRPDVRAENIANLYFAGDWVRNQVDLACMEGAVCSAIDCARAVAQSFGVGSISPPRVAPKWPEPLMRAVKWAAAPLMVPVFVFAKLWPRKR